MKNVREFGAVGDGKTLDTQAIQRAIDAGGTVYIPEGTYLTGTLYLKSNGGLYLASGARLCACHDRSAYNAADFCPQNQVWPAESMAGTHLIVAVEQENVFIAGFGVIDGDSHYWVNEQYRESYCEFWGHPPLSANRPAQMIFFAECKNVRVENVTLRQAPFWHLFFHGCTEVFVRGITVYGERRQWVNDGIDIDCCSNVTVSDCIIDTGDDGITLRANGRPLTRKSGICEHVVVSNCVISSYLDYGIRVGVGDGLIRDCSFSNLIIRNSLMGIGMTNRFLPEGDCVSIENISFSDISIEAKCALELKLSNVSCHPPLKRFGYTRNIRFNNVYMKTNRCCLLLGYEGGMLSDVAFNNSRLEFIPEAHDDRYPCRYSALEQNERNDCVLYTNRVRDVVFNHLEVKKGDLAYDILQEDAIQ